jgi:pimeloyl-ACP methyl ester carboxylesterase
MRHIRSPGFPYDEAAAQAEARVAWRRGDGSHAAEGARRQLAAIRKSGDRTPALADIVARTLVLHGDRDRMIHPSGANATADAIPGARQQAIPGLGHDLPLLAWPLIIDLIAKHARRPPAPSASVITDAR